MPGPVPAKGVMVILTAVGFVVLLSALLLPGRWPGIIGGAAFALLSAGCVLALHIIEKREAGEWPRRHRTTYRRRR